MIHWISALAANGNGQGSIWALLIPMLFIFLVFQFMFGGQRRREERRKGEMVKSLKKNDRIVTIGGIIGSVVSATPDGKEVTIKVDDNTRIKLLGSAVQSVLNDESEDESSKK